MKIKYIHPIFIFLLLSSVIFSQSPTSGKNYILTTDYLTENGESQGKIRSIQYMDGLGRPQQNILYRATPDQKDIVTKITYDGFGRQLIDYLPLPTAQNTGAYIDPASLNGNYYLTQYAQTTWYSEKTLEESPLNRVMAQAAPGDQWAKGAGHEIAFEYKTNTTGEVKIFKINSNYTGFSLNGHYAPNQLYKITTTDENGNKTHEFKDKQGRVVLKRTTVANGSIAGRNTDPDPGMEPMGVVETYYVYDVYGNLAFVIPPLAAAKSDPNTVKDELCYQYKYDSRNRLIEKKLPGKGWEYLVYDKQDRIVATQDQILKDQGKWLFTKYDDFGRIVYTGIYSNSSTRSSLQLTVNGLGKNSEERKTSSQFTLNGQAVHYTRNLAFPVNNVSCELLSVNYYDYYGTGSSNTIPMNGAPDPESTSYRDGRRDDIHENSVKGLPVAVSLRIIGSSNWEHTYTYYDAKSIPAMTYKKNHLGGFTQTESTLDFRGKPTQVTTTHKRNSSGVEVTVTEFFTYDSMERLTRHTHKINSGPEQLISKNEYEPLGQLKNKKQGGTDLTGNNRWQQVDYSYNIRGWLTDINSVGPVLMGKDAQPPTMGDDLFAFKIQYDLLVNGGSSVTDPLYNGNISQTFWKTAGDNTMRGYHYTYDQMNRLRKADFYKQGNANITAYGEYLAYDLNGNIKHLVRSTGDANDNEIAMDDLTYTYDGEAGSSNKLMRVTEGVTTGGGTGGFKDGTNPMSDDYEYDENGNMIKDLNKAITSITYNHLNLPTEIYWAADKKINYLYNTAGQKVQKTVRDGNTQKIVDYLDGFQYAGAVLQFFPHAEGYVKATPGLVSPGNPPTNYFYNYVYNYTDHLGNVRLSYSLDPLTQQLKIMDENHYYPFGLRHSVYAAATPRDFKEDPGGPGGTIITNVLKTDYQYKYNGKEFQDELGLNMYAMDMRQYDPAIARWVVMDPVVHISLSPYNAFDNNPVFWADPSGADAMVNIGYDREVASSDMMGSVQFSGATITESNDWVPSVAYNKDENGKTTSGELVVKAEKKDSPQSLATFLGVDQETANELYKTKNNKGIIVVPNDIAGVRQINNAINHAIENPNDYDIGIFNFSNYSCYESAYKIMVGEEIDYENVRSAPGIDPYSSLNQHIRDTSRFKDVADNPSQYKFGHSLIRFGNKYGNSQHAATYLGTSSDGTIYTWSKNGNMTPPNIQTTKQLEKIYNASIQGLRSEEGGGIYNQN